MESRKGPQEWGSVSSKHGQRRSNSRAMTFFLGSSSRGPFVSKGKRVRDFIVATSLSKTDLRNSTRKIGRQCLGSASNGRTSVEEESALDEGGEAGGIAFGGKATNTTSSSSAGGARTGSASTGGGTGVGSCSSVGMGATTFRRWWGGRQCFLRK